MIRIALTLGLFLAGCADVQRAVDNTARQSAKAAVAEGLALRFPQVPKALVTPFTDCIIDNASGYEIGEFAKDAITGVDAATSDLIRVVLARPATQTCLGSAALTSGLNF